MALWLSLALAGAPVATAQQAAENEIKSELLARLPLFVTWPGDDLPAGPGPIVIGILGVDPLGDEIERSTEGRQAAGHPYRVVRFRELRELGGRRPPHVLFVSASERENYETVVRALEREPVLRVGEDREFLQAGGDVTVEVRGNRPEVVIALERLQNRGFQVDSRLVEVARLFVARDGFDVPARSGAPGRSGAPSRSGALVERSGAPEDFDGIEGSDELR